MNTQECSTVQQTTHCKSKTNMQQRSSETANNAKHLAHDNSDCVKYMGPLNMYVKYSEVFCLPNNVLLENNN